MKFQHITPHHVIVNLVTPADIAARNAERTAYADVAVKRRQNQLRKQWDAVAIDALLTALAAAKLSNSVPSISLDDIIKKLPEIPPELRSTL